MKICRLAAIVSSLLMFSLLASCSSSSVEQTQTVAKSAEPTPVPMAATFTRPLPASNSASAKTGLAAPTADEVNRVVWRVFDKIAATDLSRKPALTMGDFNGDGSEDLAVFIKPNEGQFSEINNELANWVLEDPKNVTSRSTKSPAPPSPVHAQKEDLLLAVIHGVGVEGWRNPEAKQTYLLKNDGATQLFTQSMRYLKANHKGSLPQLRGDVISETVSSQAGILYWNGARYAWYRTASK